MIAPLHNAPPPPARITFWGVAVLVVLACGASAYWQLFTTFRFWDDEGYVLISLRNFAAGGELYREVFSQYGPFYNLLFGFAHRFLSLPLDAATARICVGIIWVSIALCSYVLLFRAARSPVWSVTAALSVFVLLSPLTHEPMHPVGLITLLLVIGTVSAALALAAGRDARATLILAVTGTFLALIKINVGAFYLAGAGVFTLWSLRTPFSRPWARAAVVAGAILAGAALMRPLIHEPWVQTFLVLYAVAALTTLGVLAVEVRADCSIRATLVSMALGGGGVLVVVLGAAFAAGMGPAQLLDGMIIGPLHHPTAFSLSFRWSGLTRLSLAINLIAFVIWFAFHRRQPTAVENLVAGFRVLSALGFLVSFYHGFAVSPEGYLLSFGPGFLWAFAAPLSGEIAGWRRARQLIVALALLQILHAFPVAGTQISVGTALLALLMILALADAGRWLGAKK